MTVARRGFAIVGGMYLDALRLLALATLAAASAGLGSGPALASAERYGRVEFRPCTLAAPGMADTVAARCGTLTVAEAPPAAKPGKPGARRAGSAAQRASEPARLAPGSGEIRLAIAWVQAGAKRPRPDPVVMLAGGPGQSARESFPLAVGAFREILRHRDVLLIDQRGTGGSNPLRCSSEAEPERLRAAQPGPAEIRRLAAECAAGLDADLRHYTTSDAVRDLESVREALGLERWNLLGISYGTRLGLEYLRRHPGRVRTLVLDAVVPPQLALGAEHARNLETALDAQFASCATEPICRERFGAPRETLDRLLERVRRDPPSVRYRDPFSHALREETLTAERIAGVARLYAYAPQLGAMLPMSLYEALAGRPETLMAQARMIEGLVGQSIADGLQLSVACTEDVDLLRADPADARTLLGTAFVETLQAQCKVWPRGTRPADFHDPVRSDRPVLLLSGEFDPVTPPRYGELVAGTLPASRHLVVRGEGHGVIGAGCMPRLLARFVEGADPAALDASCLERLQRVPPFTGSHGWEP